MHVPRILPSQPSPPPTGLDPASGRVDRKVDAPATDPADRFDRSRVDLGQVFETRPREPVKPDLLATWHYQAEDKHSIQHMFRNPDGRTYVVADSFDTDRDRRQAPASYTAAFDAQGQPLWTWRPEGGHRITSHLFRSDGTTFIVSRGEDSWGGSHLVRLNAHGVEEWRYESGSREYIDSVRTGPDGTLYVKQGDKVVALAADGGKRWEKSLGLNADEFFHVAGPDGTQYFTADNFSMNFGYDSFRALSPKGKVKDADFPDIGTFPLEVGSRLVYGGEKGEIHGLDLAGGKSWEVQTDSIRGLKTPWLGRDGNVYAEGRFDHKLHAVSPDGKLLWSREITDVRPGGFDERFHVDSDGSVYYAVERSDEIQRILPDGRLGERVRGGENLDSFRPGGDGRLYTWSADGAVGVHDLEKKQSWSQPVEMEHPQVWNLEDVLPNGVVVLKNMDEVYHLQPSREKELKEALERAVKGKPETGKEIAPEEGWIRIGDVRLPVNV